MLNLQSSYKPELHINGNKLKNANISLAVPVYGTASFLPALLDSILEQSQTPTELIIVNDGSPDTKPLKKTLKAYKKPFSKSKIKINLIEHHKNLGTLESRRTAVINTKCKYIFFADPDDTLTPNALEDLYETAISSSADIIHGKMDYKLDISESDKNEKTEAVIAELDEDIKSVYTGILENEEIIENVLLKNAHNSFLCAKLFKTEPLLQAFAEIPYTECCMAEDFLIYFFVMLKAKRYIGIDKIVYNYYLGRGISSNKEITDLTKWEKACTAASVMTIILSYLEEQPFQSDNKAELMQALQNISLSRLQMNLKHLGRVAPAIKAEARQILYDYWGEELVKLVEERG